MILFLHEELHTYSVQLL